MVDREGDRQVLKALESAGSDLSKPAHVIHFLYFQLQDAAESAAGELRAGGFENVRVGPAPMPFLKRLLGKKQYSCIAETRTVPSEANVFAATGRMNALAGRLGGVYDGWEASVER